jgi:hypothetical protein
VAERPKAADSRSALAGVPRFESWPRHPNYFDGHTHSKLYGGYRHRLFVATTIQLSSGTRSRLAELKETRRETYDEVVNKLLSLVPTGDDEGPYTQAFRVSLLNARLDIREGRTIAHAQLKRRLNL